MRSALPALAALAIVLAAAPARADGPRATWRADDEPHAGVPFELDLYVDGLDEAPAPEQPKLVIPDATVRALGAVPNVSRQIQIVNGQRSDFTQVTWVFRWSVTMTKEGTLHVPSVTVVQGGKRAIAMSAEANVDAIPTTGTMKLELTLPDRPVFVGENIPVTLTWLFQAEPQKNPTFQVPMLDGDAFTIGTPPATNQRTYKFQGGDKELDLPFSVDDTELDGIRYHRLRATFYAAPKKTGKVEILPATVVVALPVGQQDFFGNSPSRLFRASDVAHTLEVKPLPETDRPAGFAGAVGTQFSMTVTTSRSVVQLGEPVELTITVKSDQRLDTLALGPLDGPGGLPKDKFSVPANAPTGTLSDDGKTKTFEVTAQLTGPATEIPALAFSYFDPVKGQYQTVHSDPIALSVKGSAIVGAGDVVSASPRKPGAAAPSGDTELTLVGADLALSSPGDRDSHPLGGTLLWLILGVCYVVPLAILLVRRWQLRTRDQREEAAEVRAARRKVEQELARAAKDPARETSGALAAAVRGLARALEVTLDDAGLLARLETEGFAPGAATSPLSPDLRVRVEQLVQGWTRAARRPRKGKAAAAAATVLVVLAGAGHVARADALDDARHQYQDALAETNASARRAQLQAAERAFEDAARAHPDRPELLADWGTAALAAGDVATATLAYRRALAIDGDNARARQNLAWLRERQPEALRPPATTAAEALLFFNRWPRSRRLVVGALAFALAVLLVVPWTSRRRRGLAGLAVVPAVIWFLMLVSVAGEDRHTDDAVVTSSTVLRAADSAGAPAAMAEPLPAGTEITVVERRDAWARVRVANGAGGWVESGAVEQVQPR